MSASHKTSETSAPVGCPGFGANYNPFTPPFLDDPYAFYEAARREAPVFYSPALNMHVVTRYDDICTVLADPTRFSSCDTLGFGLRELSPETWEVLKEGFPMTPFAINSDPPVHTRLRRVLSKGFTPRRITATEPSIRAFAEKLVDGFAAAGRVDLVPQFAYPLPVMVILSMVGMPVEDLDQVKRWCDDWFALIFVPMPPERQVECARSAVRYQRYCAELIADRRRAPREDLVSDLLTAEIEGEAMTEAELVNTIGASLIAAGHETTTRGIANCVKALLGQREHWEAVKRDRSLIPKAVEETLRWDSTALGFVRTATEPVTIGGVDLPQGARLYLLYGSGNRDESRFPDAARFNLDRDAQGHLAFGRGVHFCLGAALARIELQVSLEVLMDRLPRLRLVEGQHHEYVPHLTIRGFKHLEVAWDVA